MVQVCVGGGEWGAVQRVGAGWGHSAGGWCLARIRNIINLHNAFLLPDCLHVSVCAHCLMR